MLMKQYGYVTEISDGTAKVRVMRESSCGGNCVSCKGCPAGVVTAECMVKGEVSVGDRVCLTMGKRSFYKGVFFGYGFTAALMVIGSVVGYSWFSTEGASVLGAVIGLGIGLISAKLVFNGKSEITAEKTE